MFYNNNHSKLLQNILRIFLIFQLDTTSMVLNFLFVFFYLTIIIVCETNSRLAFWFQIKWKNQILKFCLGTMEKFEKYVFFSFFFLFFFFQLKTDKLCSYIIPWKALTVDITHKRFSNRLSNVILSSSPSITMATGSQSNK